MNDTSLYKSYGTFHERDMRAVSRERIDLAPIRVKVVQVFRGMFPSPATCSFIGLILCMIGSR